MKRLISVALVTIIILSFSVNTYAAEPEASAESYVLINADTLEILVSKNETKRLSMASTTKLMTSLLLFENCDLERTFTASKIAVTVEGTSMGLREGDRVSCYALLVGMLLQSGNDAANVSAEAVAGSIPSFIKLMNEKAASLGMSNTHFATPSGLDADDHYTTAYDMALLAAAVLKVDFLRKITSSKLLTVKVNEKEVTYYNHNKLLSSYSECIGLKTGYTVKSGRCLVTAATRQGTTVICVTLKDSDDYSDHEKLLKYGLELLTAKTLERSDIDTANVVGGTADKVKLTYESLTVGVSGNENDEFSVQINKPPFLYAPLNIGDTVGTVTYKYGDYVIKTVPLTAASDVEAETSNNTANNTFINGLIKILKYI